MARFYVPLDVNYQLDDKIMCAGHVAECLYVRALAYAKRAGTEGRIKHSQLRALALGLPGQLSKHAAALVGVGLWEAVGDEYYITGWLNHNLTNAALIEQKATIRRKSILGNHKRHHVAKGVTDDDCEICSPPHGEQNISPQGGQTLAIEENRTEPKKNRTELNRTEPKRKESSSSPGEPDTDHGLPANDDDEMIDWLKIKAALAIVAVNITARKPRTDAHSYERAINQDRERLMAIRTLWQNAKQADAETLASIHLNGPQVESLPPTPTEAWYADPQCQHCDGEGFKSYSGGWLVPCDCRQPEPHLATIHPINPQGA